MEKTYTPKQEEVISLNSGYNMVLAGPGCGKTDILAERVARAYEKGDYRLEDMLCLTFTNRAARGMLDRIKTRLGNDYEDLFVGNIHRYCSHFLYQNGIIPAETAILDDVDLENTLKSEIPDITIQNIIYYRIGFNKNTGRYEIVIDWKICDLLGINVPEEMRYSRVLKKVEAPKYLDTEYSYRQRIIDRSIVRVEGRNREATTKIKYCGRPFDWFEFEEPKIITRIIREVRNKISQYQHIIYQQRHENKPPTLLHSELPKNIERTLAAIDDKEEDGWRQKQRLKQSLRLISIEAERFGVYKDQNGFIDFDDLLIQTYEAYSADNDKKFKRFNWVQVDEIQDLSNFQIALIDALTDTTGKFVAVYLGDEQQAIYSFMGATMKTLEKLKSRCGENLFRLDKNFRSPKYLLDLYNDYAVKELKIDKDFLPLPQDDNNSPDKYDVCLHLYDSEEEETQKIDKTLLPYLIKKSSDEERTALLVPWNSDADQFSERLKESGIPHYKISGKDSFQTDHIKTLLAHLSLVYNEFNNMAWAKLLAMIHISESESEGRIIVNHLRDNAMTPSDLLRDDSSTYLINFCKTFDNDEIVLFDTETTGVDIFNDDIIQIAAVKLRNGEIVPNTNFNIFLETNKTIPEKLGKLDNPMITEYPKAVKLTRAEGLKKFLEYSKGLPLLAHNIQFDYNILKNNLKRDSPENYQSFKASTYDSLKLAHLLFPRLRKYKLGMLLTEFNIQGKNSHLADDDINATYELVKFCREYVRKEKLFDKQKAVLADIKVKRIGQNLSELYKECYNHSKMSLYILRDIGCSLIEEFRYADNFFSTLTEHSQTAKILRSNKANTAMPFEKVECFEAILSFLQNDIITREKPNSLYSQLSNHLMDICTLREADLCDSKSFKQRIFVSTVHKAKGLEFENVVVLRATKGRYPHFYSANDEESKRLFYVAISRAKKRLIVSGDIMLITSFIESTANHFLVRFERQASNKKLLIEISATTLTSIYTQDEKNKIVREYGPLTDYFLRIKNDIRRAAQEKILKRSKYEDEMQIQNKADEDIALINQLYLSKIIMNELPYFHRDAWTTLDDELYSLMTSIAIPLRTSKKLL